jgi:hypothetical protein
MRFSAENGLRTKGWRGVCNFVRAAKERFESHSLPAYSSEVRTNVRMGRTNPATRLGYKKVQRRENYRQPRGKAAKLAVFLRR